MDKRHMGGLWTWKISYFIIGGMQIKETMSNHFTPVKMAWR